MIWFPAHTCPKDGSEFLAYDAKADKTDVCYYTELSPGKGYIAAVQSDCGMWPFEDEFGYDEKAIIAWMPLPARPGMACPIKQEAA